MAGEEKSPVDQFVDLFVYAPVGLLYEYPDVLPKLIKRGRSQVQLARVLGQMAAKQGSGGIDDTVGAAVTTLAKSLGEVCAVLGITPDGAGSGSVDADDASEPPSTASPSLARAVVSELEETAVDPSTPLPIAGYDDMRARDVIPLLDDLTPAQRERVRAHELAGRARKTVLAKLDRLDP